jgi:hypothetical protein
MHDPQQRSPRAPSQPQIRARPAPRSDGTAEGFEPGQAAGIDSDPLWADVAQPLHLPARYLVFDLNDFDETHPGPWELDLKRLVSSIVAGGRDFLISDDDCCDNVLACVCFSCEHLREYSRFSPLEVWYNRLDMENLIAMAPDERAKQQRRDLAEKARGRVFDHLFFRITTSDGGRPRILHQAPVLLHPALEDFR